MSGSDVHLMLASKIAALPQVGNLNLADADGRLINSARAWPVPSVNIADRAYFGKLKANPESATALSEPVFNRITGAWTAIIARSMTGTKGEFLGVVLGGIELAQVETFFASTSLGNSSSISMFDNDGTLLARYPHVDAMIGRNFGNGPVRKRLLAGGGHGNFRSYSPVDGLERIGSISRLRDYPILISATTTVSAALAAWWDQVRVLIAAACLSMILITLLVFLIVRRLSLEHHRSKQRLALEKQRLDIALANMSQGLLMCDATSGSRLQPALYRDVWTVAARSSNRAAAFAI